MQIVPRTFCHISTKMSVLCGLQKTPKSVFGRGSAPDPLGELDYDVPPDPLVG